MHPLERIDDPVKLRRLVQSMLILDGELSLPVVLRRLVEEACALVDARYGALGVVDEQGASLEQFLTVGLEPEEDLAIGARPTGQGILGSLIIDAKPLRLADLTKSPDSYGVPGHHPNMTSFLGVPVRVQGEVYGNLYLTNKTSAPEFSEEDEATAMALALAAGIAIQNARLHTVMREHTLTEDRDRIARDLHDSVIQRLFAVELLLHGTARMVERPEVTGRITEAIDKLDETIRQLRTAIFDLDTRQRDGIRRQINELVLELSPVLGIHPRLAFVGAVDSALPEALGDHLLATLREALTNVSKHAGASEVVVTIAVGDELQLVVADNGRGVTDVATDGLGLKNLRNRAERLGGALDIGKSREGGTRLSWRVPLSFAEDETGDASPK
jgi:signal transduction histidine kinase